MNLSPRPSHFDFWRMVSAFVRPILIVNMGGIGAGLAAFAFETANGELPYYAGTIAVLVTGIVWATLAAVAAWGIRYPRPVKAEPRPVILDKPVQDKPTPAPDYNELPGREGQSYEATMQRRKPAPWIRLSEEKLARVIPIVLTGKGSINVLDLQHICRRRELTELRQDLINHGWADRHGNTAIINDLGRVGLAELLPRLSRG